MENTATNVASGYSESDISFDNAWLHDFPTMYYTTSGNSSYLNPEKYAFIRYGSSVKSVYYVANPAGGKSYSSKSIANQYASAKGSGDFSTAAQLLEANSTTYNNILVGLQTFGEALDVDDLYNAAGNMDAAISAFVKLWQDSGSVDDAVNSFVMDSSLDHWQQTVRYLDLLLIVNSMCNRAWDESINYYLEHLNQDGSEYFVAVVAAAAVNYTVSTGGSQALMTLPVYYARRTGRTVSDFVHWDGSGNWDEVQSTFNSYPTNSRTGYHMEGTDPANNTQKIWWNQGESGSAHLATSAYPVGSDGSLGFCGYTYIAPTIKFSTEDIHPSSSSNPNASDSEPATTLTPTFTVEVTTEDAYMQRDTTQPVTATVTIDMSQDDSVRRYFSWLYDTEDLSDYKTAIEVFVERTFSDSSGLDTSNAVMDTDDSGGYFAYAVQPYPYTNCVVYRWQGTDWDSGSNQLKDVMDGTNQIIFDDEGLSLAGVTEGTPLNATYHVGIRMAIYRSSVADEDAFEQATWRWIFQGTGKTVCEGSDVESDCSTTFFVRANTGISTTQSAHDDAEWICPKGVQWYSSLRDKTL